MLVGCAHKVVVRDTQGQPIPGAEVTPVSPSINYASAITDEKGCARLKWWYAQKPMWLSVAKKGHQSVSGLAFPKTWPAEVVLQPSER